MKVMGLAGVLRGKKVRTTFSRKEAAAGDRVNRQFVAQRPRESFERVGYALLWAVMLMNSKDISQSVAGLATALLVLAVCSTTGKSLTRFWPRDFFVLFYTVHLAVLGIIAGT